MQRFDLTALTYAFKQLQNAILNDVETYLNFINCNSKQFCLFWIFYRQEQYEIYELNYFDNYKVVMKVLQNNSKNSQIQSRLNKYSYLSKNSLPGYNDAHIIRILQTIQRFPNRKNSPNFYHWYIMMKQFSKNTTGQWINSKLYYDSGDTLIQDFAKLYKKTLDEKNISQNTSTVFNGTQFLENLQIQQPMIIRILCTNESINFDKIVQEFIQYEGIKFTKEKQTKNLASPLIF